jgi:hypothetical protein
MVIRSLKTLAVQRGYVIFLLCHTSKAAGYEREVDFNALRDSSFVAQESDCVLIICRNIKDADSGQAKLRVEFHRRTGTLKGLVHLVKVGGYLREEAREENA